MRAAWAAVMVIGIVACHKSPEVEPWPTREVGDYSYRVSATPVFGTFSILADTVSMEAQQQSCRRVGMGVRDGITHHFRCLAGSKTFDATLNSRSPWLSTWSTSTTVEKKVETCTKEKFEEGRRVCVSTRTDVKKETVRSSGRLDVTRIASAEKP